MALSPAINEVASADNFVGSASSAYTFSYIATSTSSSSESSHVPFLKSKEPFEQTFPIRIPFTSKS